MLKNEANPGYLKQQHHHPPHHDHPKATETATYLSPASQGDKPGKVVLQLNAEAFDRKLVPHTRGKNSHSFYRQAKWESSIVGGYN